MTDLRKEIELHYAASKAPRMGMGDNPALLIVDFVEGFTNPNSPLAGNWDEEVTKFLKVMPTDYERVLNAVKKAEESGLEGDAAILSAFEENAKAGN